jgi:imidazolonepropionase-like amidohydrolase
VTRIAALLVLTLATLATLPAQGENTFLRCARWLDPVAGELQGPSVFEIANGEIVRIIPAADFDRGTARASMDLGSATVLPGLVDAHVHLEIESAPVDTNINPAHNALTVLRAGFTTVVDLGATSDAVIRVRDRVAAGTVIGPRILAAGLWAGVKNGVCEFGGIGIADGPAGFRARVRDNVAAGADLIKICVSNWLAPSFQKPGEYEIDDASLAAAVDESRRQKRPVIAHAISLGSVKASIRAGVSGLAHAAFLDEATAAEMKAAGMFMIPTLASLVADRTGPPALALRQSVALAHRAGVPLVFGTDGGVLPHGQNSQEFMAMAAAGIPPIDTIRAATVNAARAFDLGLTGRIVVGARADLIAVDGNPLDDVAAMTRVIFVMRNGRAFR